MAVYTLSRDLDRERFKRRVNALYARGATVEMVEQRRARSLSQNAYLHLLLQYFAVQQGEGDVSYVKEQYYKRVCNAALFVRQRHDALLGRAVEVLRSTRALTVDEMTASIDRFKVWAAQQGVYLPDAARPDEIAQAQEEVAAARTFLLDS